MKSKLLFEEKLSCHGLEEMLLLSELNAKEGGFLVNNEVKIIAEVDVLQVIGKLDVSENTQPRKG